MGPTIDHSVESNSYRREAAATAKTSAPAEKTLPQFGHRIAIDNREGVFIVLRTDAENGTVDVLRVSGVRQIEASIPLSSVRVLSSQNWGDLSEKIDD